MKKILIFAFSIILFTSCEKEKKFVIPKTSLDLPKQEMPGVAPENRPKQKLTVITFEKTEHDFGTIKAGDEVQYSFKFENTGKNDLIISKAFGSCGCTVPDFPKEPIKPSEEGKIKVSFNSKNKYGEQSKTIYVYANTERGVENLKIKASIPGGKTRKKNPLTNTIKK